MTRKSFRSSGRARRTAAAAVVCLLGLAGCSRTDHRIPDAAPPEPEPLYQPSSAKTALPEHLVERPAYRLNIGDVIEIIYQVRNVVTGEPYELKIEFLNSTRALQESIRSRQVERIDARTIVCRGDNLLDVLNRR